MSNKEYSVKLKVFKGKKTFDENGNMLSTNHCVDLEPYKSLDWNNYMANCRNLGYTSAEVVEVREIIYTEIDHPKKKGEKKIVTEYNVLSEIPQEIIDSVKDAFSPKVVKELTPQEKEMQALREQIEELKALAHGKKSDKPSAPAKEAPKVDELKDVDNSNSQLNEVDILGLRDKYKELYGKKAHHSWTAETLIEKIAAKQ